METKIKAGKGRVVVSVEHPATTPTVRVQRLATRELSKYRKWRFTVLALQPIAGLGVQ